ncbi:flagellar hook-length control protein FliK [Sporomusa termitida]|uniref:Flagellar hook-length control protein FliK n=1 Tax=Sporomusa termitida TaxID=2377 RepID=A0A517DT11_9FIRM|nr:flagellar hook-length control protein FliK [Sporomusa termitida]QDR80494.1 Flagellar hook-length control protein FliK [Sporomusa termitida]
MNTAQNMLPVQPSATPAASGKNTAARSGSQQKSFSDTLSGSVAKSDKAPAAARDQATANEAKQAGNSMLPGGIPNPAKKAGNTANSQTPAKPAGEPADREQADLTQLGQSAVAVDNTGLLSQILLAAVGAYQLPAAGAEPALAPEAADAAAGAAGVGQETAAEPSVPELPAQPARQAMVTAAAAEAEGAGVNLSKQSLDSRPAGAQSGQAQLPVNPDIAGPAPGPATAAATDRAQTAGLQTAFAVHGKEAVRATEQPAAEVVTDAEQQPALPVAAAASPARSSRQNAGEGQQEDLTDSALFEQALATKNANANLKEATPSIFLQGLETALLSKNDALAGKVADGKLPTGPATDMYQVVDQIVEQSRVVAKLQNTAMVIKLKPEHLGELTLKVVVENGAINASFHSNNPEVRSIIEASLPQLKQELVNNGLKVENVGVYAGLSQFLPNHDQERNSRQQFAKLTNKKNAGEFVEAIVAETEAGKMNGTGGLAGVDYRI